jgi:hypothetical protein
MLGGAMSKATVWFMDARSRRFLESTAIKGRQILEHSGWLDHLKQGDIVAWTGLCASKGGDKNDSQ